MTFKNETSDRMEICVPVTVTASVRLWIEEGEELTADAINAAVNEAAHAADDDVIHLPGFGGDMCISVLGVEPNTSASYYNHEKEGDTDFPEGVEYAAVLTDSAMFNLLCENFDAWDNEEDSVKEEHAELIEKTEAFIDANRARFYPAKGR